MKSLFRDRSLKFFINFYIINILVVFLFTNLQANDLFVQKGHFGLSYDSISLPKDENMGLLGADYLYDFKYGIYFGLGVYGAVTGNRGGFFTGGVEVGKKTKIYKNIYIDTGVFAGGGGGGSAPQGGGLMLRPHVGVLYDKGNYSIEVGLSKIKFPSGDINSNQVFLQLNFPFELIHKKNSFSSVNIQDIDTFVNSSKRKIGWRDHYFAITLQKYMPHSDSKTTNGTKLTQNIMLVGFEYGTKINRNIFTFMEVSGAAGGDVDGYAEILGGVGYIKNIKTYSGIFAKASIGAAGGGRVDTGGGVVAKESIGVYSKLIKNLTLSTEIGHIDAIGGNFHAFTFKTSLNYGVKFLSFGNSLRSIEGYTLFKGKEWDIKISNQSYLKKNTKNSNINLIGFKIDRYIDTDTYISAEALGAYSGGSGGYAVGLLGAGKRFVVNKKFNLFTELLVGGAGGGGVDVGGGFVYQPMIGAEYRIKNNLGVDLSFGKVRSISGNLDTNVLNIGFSYKFQTIE